MTKLILTALVMGLTSLASALVAPAQPLQPLANSNPLTLNSNMTFYGAESYRIEASTPADTAVLLFSGPGLFLGMSCSSGTAGSFGQAFDSTTISGITIATLGKAVSPEVQTGITSTVNVSTNVATVSFSACNAPGLCGVYTPPSGSKRIHNGLVALKHGDASTSCIIDALTDAQIASGSH